MRFFEVIFDSTKRELRRLEKEVARINEVATQIAGRDDAWCRERIAQIRAEIEPAPYEKQKELMTKHLPEVFAIVRDVSERTVGMRHFDVQMMAGIVLHEGRIAEQKTGEGKTLSATLALSLNALTGHWG